MNKLPKIKDKHLKIEIGCGNTKQPGFIGIDVRDCGQEIIWDVRGGIPLPDESVSEIYSSHVLEHFDNEELKALFKEFVRVLEPGGKIGARLPHQLDPSAYYFDHKTFWNEGRVDTLPGVPGLGCLKVTKNEATNKLNNVGFMELFFELKKYEKLDK